MSSWFSSKAIRDALILTAVGLAVWYAGVQLDLMDRLFVFAEEHENYEIDEVLLSLFICGLLGFVYAFRRIVDLRVEIGLRHKAEADTTWIAQHDMLTRLPNRRLLDKFVADVAAGHHPEARFVVYALDLDGFKKVNDLLGHHGGNDLLVEVAARMQHVFPNDLVVRLGGDEFAIVAADAPSVDPDAMARKLVLAIERPLIISNVQVQVGASVGIAVCPSDSGDLTEVLRFADIALYAAKRRGRNHVARFEKSMDDALAQRSEAEAALREAVARDEIVPHYQPLVDLEAGTVRGFEALARWETADGRSVPPGVFIELAEELGHDPSLRAFAPPRLH